MIKEDGFYARNNFCHFSKHLRNQEAISIEKEL